MVKLLIDKVVRKLAIYMLGSYYFLRFQIASKRYVSSNGMSVCVNNSNDLAKVAVIIHLYYKSCWNEMCYYLSNIREPIDLYISLGDDIDNDLEESIISSFNSVKVYRLPNVGRDIAPFVHIYNQIKTEQYDAICKIHSKKSKHRIDGTLWRHYLFGRLLGSAERVETSINILRGEVVGIVSPLFHKLCSKNNINENRVLLSKLIASHGEKFEDSSFSYVGGSMFWFYPPVFTPLQSIDVTHFEKENGQLDGTLAHAIERYFGYLVMKVSSMRIEEI